MAEQIQSIRKRGVMSKKMTEKIISITEREREENRSSDRERDEERERELED